jgi:succinylglutamate desuccinylase
VQREIGRVTGAEPGPSFVVVAGVHGNEPAGIEAGQRVLDRVAAQGELRGELVVLAGNVAALRCGARYLQRDLNRSWTDAQIARLSGKDPASLHAEDREQHELLAALGAVQARARGVLVLADCHTSSAPGIPFVLYGASPAQRAFVQGFPIPVISGIVEQVEGVLSEFIGKRGWVTFSVEGGQHDAAVSRDSLEAIVWLSLRQARMIEDHAEAARATQLLDDLRGDLPRIVEVVSRHAITAEDAFVMERGFRNVDRISKGQLLARDRRGEVRAQENGVVVLPLYQKLGNDGFFWGREVA